MYRVKSWLLLLMCLAFGTTGCLSTLLGTKDARSTTYRLPPPGAGWEIIDPAEADAAFRNSVDRAILNVNSICGEERFASLEELSAEVLKQIPEYVVVQPGKAVAFGGHPGYTTEVKGLVDGEPIEVRLAVIRTQTCVYDFILAGTALDFSSRVAFDRALAEFRDGSKP